MPGIQARAAEAKPIDGQPTATVPVRILMDPGVARVLAEQIEPAAGTAERWLVVGARLGASFRLPFNSQKPRCHKHLRSGKNRVSQAPRRDSLR
jgi:hypothetical protein